MHGSPLFRSSHATCAAASLHAIAHDFASGSGLPSAPTGFTLWPRKSQPPFTRPRWRLVSSTTSASPSDGSASVGALKVRKQCDEPVSDDVLAIILPYACQKSPSSVAPSSAPVMPLERTRTSSSDIGNLLFGCALLLIELYLMLFFYPTLQ
jgi:hypothetical protein